MIVPNVIEYDCSNKNLTDLDLSQCPDLQRLYCYRNKLTSLDFRECPNILKIWCFDNQIESLIFPEEGLLNLQELRCFDNQLKALDLSKCPNLKKIISINNPFCNKQPNNGKQMNCVQMNCVQMKTKEFLEKYNFMNIEVLGDGNCFFHSIYLHFLLKSFTKTEFSKSFTKVHPVPQTYNYKNTITSSKKYRDDIFEYIHDNIDIQKYLCLYGGYESNELLKEVEELSEDTKYEVPLFDFFPIIVANLYKVNVVIYPVDVDSEQCDFKDPQKYRGIDEKDSSETIHLLYINGIHYELLFPVH
jgi:Leucine-rich repeat (LRR) protein